MSSLGQGVTFDSFILAFEKLLFCPGLIDGPRPVASLATRSPSFVLDFSSLTLDSSHSTGDLRDPSATPVMEKLFPELLSTHRWGDLAIKQYLNKIDQMACGTAGIVGLFIYKVFSGSYSLIRSINCSITGMVSLCAGCNLFAPWASCVVAAVGASAYLLVSGLLVALRIDDPVDAIAVHGAGGIVGILAVPVFMEVLTVIHL